jgi:diguanylate cyclase (GGDEF)-like protein
MGCNRRLTFRNEKRWLAHVLIRSVLVSILAWVPGLAGSADLPPAIDFSAQERSYIAQAGILRMCVDPDWMPFERINEAGAHEGIAADLIQQVAQRVGLRIELHPVKSWEESLQASKAGVCQIMSFLNQTPQREQWLIFTSPIFSDPNVVIAREEHPYVVDLSNLSDETVALPRGTMVEERIRREYPNLQVILTGSELESVKLVSEHQADLTIRSLIVAAHAIRQEGLFNLKIAGHVPEFTNQLRIGVLRNDTLLRDILDQGVKTLTEQEREAIVNRHVVIRVQQGFDYRLVWKILAGSGLILLVSLFWIRKLRALNRKLERLSITDGLTGLYNRLKLDEVLEAEILRAGRSGQPLSVILIDVDHFKHINDQHGHQTGDRVLVELARLLRAGTRVTDLAGRWGGEEFMLICPNTDGAGACQLAGMLRQTIQDHPFPGLPRQTASFGVTSFRPGDGASEIVCRVDQALYAAKAAGRNSVRAA